MTISNADQSLASQATDGVKWQSLHDSVPFQVLAKATDIVDSTFAATHKVGEAALETGRAIGSAMTDAFAKGAKQTAIDSVLWCTGISSLQDAYGRFLTKPTEALPHTSGSVVVDVRTFPERVCEASSDVALGIFRAAKFGSLATGSVANALVGYELVNQADVGPVVGAMQGFAAAAGQLSWAGLQVATTTADAAVSFFGSALSVVASNPCATVTRAGCAVCVGLAAKEFVAMGRSNSWVGVGKHGVCAATAAIGALMLPAMMYHPYLR